MFPCSCSFGRNPHRAFEHLCVFKRQKVQSLQIETDEVDAEIRIVEFEHGTDVLQRVEDQRFH